MTLNIGLIGFGKTGQTRLESIFSHGKGTVLIAHAPNPMDFRGVPFVAPGEEGIVNPTEDSRRYRTEYCLDGLRVNRPVVNGSPQDGHRAKRPMVRPKPKESRPWANLHQDLSPETFHGFESVEAGPHSR